MSNEIKESDGFDILSHDQKKQLGELYKGTPDNVSGFSNSEKQMMEELESGKVENIDILTSEEKKQMAKL